MKFNCLVFVALCISPRLGNISYSNTPPLDMASAHGELADVRIGDIPVPLCVLVKGPPFNSVTAVVGEGGYRIYAC